MIRLGWINSLLGGLLISSCCPCCVLQLVLNLFGVGCAGLNSLLLPYRPVFVALTIISLTYSFLRYRPTKRQFLSIVTLTLFLSFSPEIFRMSNRSSAISREFDRNVFITHWQITGMHCESCRSAVERVLTKIPGVLTANVDLDSGQADLIAHVPVDEQIVVDAVQAAGFQAFKIV